MKNTPEVTVILPDILAQLTGDTRRFKARGTTLRDVLHDLGTSTPGLMVHFFDDAERIRKNIICIHGGDFVRARALGEHQVNDGDEVQIINALAGG